MEVEERLVFFKKKLAEAQKQADVSEGKISLYKEELKKYGFNTVEEAEKRVEELGEEIQLEYENIGLDIEEIQEAFDEVLKR